MTVGGKRIAEKNWGFVKMLYLYGVDFGRNSFFQLLQFDSFLIFS